MDKGKFSVITASWCSGCSQEENTARKRPVKMVRFNDGHYTHDFCRGCSVGIVSLHKKKVKEPNR